MTEPFGALAPSPAQERLRRFGHRVPANFLGWKAASLLLGPAGGRTRRAYDIDVFETQKARVYPYDNICEKRAYMAPQLWELKERLKLADAVARHREDVFYFVDVGANVGLYSLFARAECAARNLAFRAIAVEADPAMAARLRFNLQASGAETEISVFACAASDAEETLRFRIDNQNRGESRVDRNGAMEVPARPLLSIIKEARAPRVDALKIDVEGHEYDVLAAFFRDAEKSLRPKLVILEHHHEGNGRSASALCAAAGYERTLATRRNSVFALRGP